ncbi:MAG: ribosomal protein S18-alanine N-acetyltransferase [Syntrophomonas sp.]|nr:ribosomal protein S18-alanine N-acetyltransferase [Syntrophomonas sp.]
MLKCNGLIRKMTEQDLDQVMIIEKEAFTLPWSRQSYEAELKNQYADYFVCDSAGDVAAYAGMWTVFEESHITNVAVGKKFRCQGMGRRLMLEEEKIARAKNAERILLEVRPSNLAAIALYQGLGFFPANIRKNYYSDNQEDALIMIKFL